MSRYMSTITAVKTPFGSMFIHIEKEDGIPIGGWISNPLKNPDSEVTKLIECLADGLNAAIKEMAQESAYIDFVDDMDDAEDLS